MTYHMPDGRPAPALMTTVEVAEFLRLDHNADPKKSVQRLRLKKDLPAIKLDKTFRFRPDDVMEWTKTLED